MLNHPHTDCKSPQTNSYCIADLKHKMPVASAASGNLRGESVKKVIPFKFGTAMSRDRSMSYMSKYLQ